MPGQHAPGYVHKRSAFMAWVEVPMKVLYPPKLACSVCHGVFAQQLLFRVALHGDMKRDVCGPCRDAAFARMQEPIDTWRRPHGKKKGA